MKEKFARFMYGRNGADHLARFTSYLVLIFILIDVFVEGSFFYLIAFVLLIYNFVRIFSKNLDKRRAENAKFLSMTEGARKKIRILKKRYDGRKDYRFFKCPDCGQEVRVPKGRGRIRITCPKCKSQFDRTV
jgi:DNA-directed RNA polymerase subunit RPC12/RpoP